MSCSESKPVAFSEKIMRDVSGALSVAMAHMGDKLGLYAAMRDGGPVTSRELAAAAALEERYVREWLSSNAAGGYVGYDPATERFSLSPEQAVALAEEGNPACMLGFFQNVLSAIKDEEKVTNVFRTGDGIAWSDMSPCLFCGVERFFKPMYAANLIDNWLPALDGVVEKLEAGAKVIDIGCGHGSSTILMARRFPNSIFCGIDFHPPSIDHARQRAKEAGVDGNTCFDVARAQDYVGAPYDFAAIFDALHDMGDPVSAARHIRESLKPDGSFMVVEPMAGDRLEENIHPLGHIYYSVSTLVCTPVSRSQEVGLALGAQAGEKRLSDVLRQGGFSSVRRATETETNIVLEARP